MNTYKILYLFMFVFLLTVSCKKTEHKEMAPQLKIVVKDASDNLISGANVTLFDNVLDFQQSSNAIETKITGTEGFVLFMELDEIQYYFTVENNGKTNHFGVAATSNPLEAGYVLIVETVIE